MKIHDVSVPIHQGMPVFPGDPPFTVEPALQIAKGDPANVSRLHMGTHTGTHLDAPYHFVEGGRTVETVPLDVFLGRARVIALDVRDAVTARDLEAARIPPGTTRLLLKTRNSSLWTDDVFAKDFVYLAPDAADWLLARKVRLVGIDYLSVEQYGVEHAETHLKLLRGGIIAVEGLDLGTVAPGEYTLICLPLKIVGGDGSPVRAVLIEPPLPTD